MSADTPPTGQSDDGLKSDRAQSSVGAAFVDALNAVEAMDSGTTPYGPQADKLAAVLGLTSKGAAAAIAATAFGVGGGRAALVPKLEGVFGGSESLVDKMGLAETQSMLRRLPVMFKDPLDTPFVAGMASMGDMSGLMFLRRRDKSRFLSGAVGDGLRLRGDMERVAGDLVRSMQRMNKAVLAQSESLRKARAHIAQLKARTADAEAAAKRASQVAERAAAAARESRVKADQALEQVRAFAEALERVLGTGATPSSATDHEQDDPK